MNAAGVTAPDPGLVAADVARALAEDVGSGDVTAALLPDRPDSAYLLCKEDAVVCGRPWFDACHRALDPDVRIDWRVAEGDRVAKGTVLATLEGVTPPVANQLVAERPLQGYASVQDFTFAPTLIGLGVKATGLGTTSRWFRITTHVRMGQSRLRLESDVARDLKTHKWHLLQRRLLAPKHSEPLDE